MEYSPAELLITVMARLLEGSHHIAVGRASPIPGAAALLTCKRSDGRTRVSILGSRRHTAWSDGSKELFDCAAQGRIDAFFLGGAQIDGQANVNLVGVGGYPQSKARFPGSYGSAYLYLLIPRVILFREEHSVRSLVPKVDFISAPGVSAPGVYRKGGPKALVTGKALFSFDRARARFRLDSVHPGHTADEVDEATGFDFDHASQTPETPPPDNAVLELIRGPVRDEIAETYPEFATLLSGDAAA